MATSWGTSPTPPSHDCGRNFDSLRYKSVQYSLLCSHCDRTTLFLKTPDAALSEQFDRYRDLGCKYRSCEGYGAGVKKRKEIWVRYRYWKCWACEETNVWANGIFYGVTRCKKCDMEKGMESDVVEWGRWGEVQEYWRLSRNFWSVVVNETPGH